MSCNCWCHKGQFGNASRCEDCEDNHIWLRLIHGRMRTKLLRFEHPELFEKSFWTEHK